MSANPMGPMSGDAGVGDDDNDAQGIAECEQKIADLDARVTALEQKAGLGQSPAVNKAPGVIPNNKQPGGHATPFFGSYK
jgi:hypothetical protein